jgi:hypothetical protein
MCVNPKSPANSDLFELAVQPTEVTWVAGNRHNLRPASPSAASTIEA